MRSNPGLQLANAFGVYFLLATALGGLVCLEPVVAIRCVVIQTALVDQTAVVDPNAAADPNAVVDLTAAVDLTVVVVLNAEIRIVETPSAETPSATGATPNAAILILVRIVAQASASRSEVIQSATDESQTAAIPGATVVRQNEALKAHPNGAQSVVPVAVRLDSNAAQTEVGLVQNASPDSPPSLAPA